MHSGDSDAGRFAPAEELLGAEVSSVVPTAIPVDDREESRVPRPSVAVPGAVRSSSVAGSSEAVQAEPVSSATASTGTGEPDLTSWPTGRLLSTASRLVEHAWVAKLAEIDLTHAGLIVLHLLQTGPASQKQLAERARVQVQTMSRTIERLEREGLVSRVDDAHDRRRHLVSTTSAGRETWQRVRTLEADLFPTIDEDGPLRKALLDIIRTSSERRWG